MPLITLQGTGDSRPQGVTGPEVSPALSLTQSPPAHKPHRALRNRFRNVAFQTLKINLTKSLAGARCRERCVAAGP